MFEYGLLLYFLKDALYSGESSVYGLGLCICEAEHNNAYTIDSNTDCKQPGSVVGADYRVFRRITET